jgi:hypothetical protein
MLTGLGVEEEKGRKEFTQEQLKEYIEKNSHGKVPDENYVKDLMRSLFED